MSFFEVSAHDLQDARPGLQLVERLLDDEQFEPFVYGLTSDPDLLDAAKAAIIDDAGEDEEGNPLPTPEITEIAIALHFSGDYLYYLAGSGLLLQQEEFAYFSPNEGARTLSFRWSGIRPRANLKDFSVLALADSDMELNEFLKQNAKRPQVTPGNKVERTPTQQAVKNSSEKLVHLNPIDTFLNG